MSSSGVIVIEGLRSMLAHDFMRNAFVAGTFIAAAAGLVGYFVVLRNQVFSGDALSHVAFTGALAAYALGIDPLIGLFASTVIFALPMSSLAGGSRSRDVVIGTVFAWVLGLGVLFLSIYTTNRSTSGGAVGFNVLFGSIYGISGRQAVVAAVLGVATALALLAIARPLLFASVDRDVAAARGIPVGLLGLVFLALVGICVGEAVQAVGSTLIFALIVTPAAIAQRLMARPFAALWLSMALAVGLLWAGLSLSYAVQSLPPSFAVVALAFALYVAVVVGATLTGSRRRPAIAT